jgi:DNA-binding SARP family transcriptional activator/tetratricopeptide (TPR) repeat protein
VIRVRALGASEIVIGRRTVTLGAEVVFALGFHLCMRAGERLRRESVAELFWGDAEEKQRRHSLRQTLYKLRQKGLTLDEDGDELFLDPARVESDVAAALRETWPAEATPAEVMAAGTLLPGLSRAAGPRFQEWLDGLRGRLAAQHRRASLRQVTLARREGRWADLDRWALQVLASDPLNEEATLARAESAAMAGSKVVALEIIDQYLEELGDRSLQIGLPANVLRRRIAERRPEWSTRGPREVPLVGRAELMSRLTGLVEETGRGKGCAVVLWGAPGIGKTRLAEETRGFAELAGFKTITVRATAAGSARPLSVFLALIPQLRELPGAAGCDPGALAVLDRVVRGHLDHFTVDHARSIGSIRDATLSSIQELLDAVSHECRVLVLVDDLHNIDAASWELLLQLILGSSAQRTLWICTSRIRPDLVSDPATRATSVHAFHVPPLDDTETLALTSALRAQPLSTEPVPAIAQLAKLSGGNPLFVRELCAGHSTQHTTGSLPRSLRALMADRLSHLGADSLRVLRLASLLGPLATVPRLRRLHPVGSPLLASCVERLELEGIIRLSGAHTIELHECWHHSVNESLSGATRAVLADECARALTVEIHDAASTELIWRAAELFLDSGDVETALTCYSQCAEQLLVLGFPREALTILEHAYALVRTDSERTLVGVRLATALYCCWRAEEAVQLCSQLLSLPQPHTDAVLRERATLLCLRMDSLTKAYGDHRADLDAMAILAKDVRLTPETRQLICLSGLRVVFNDTASPLEDLFYEESVALSSQHGTTITGVLAQLIFSVERGHVHDIERLVAILEHSSNEIEHAVPNYLTQRVHLIALRRLGRFREALSLAESAYASFREKGFVEEAASISEAAAFACLDENEIDLAQLWLRRFEVSGRANSRAHAQSHARARLLLQSGDHQGALACCLPGLSRTNRDFLVKRRIAELATIAFCAAQTGDSVMSERCLLAVEQSVRLNNPSCFLDYPVEMAARARMLLGHEESAIELVSAYARRRHSEMRLQAAPFFETIRAHLAVLSTPSHD